MIPDPHPTGGLQNLGKCYIRIPIFLDMRLCPQFLDMAIEQSIVTPNPKP